MKEIVSKYIIIGAGLSGLTAAHQLLKNGETDILILESRDRIGGRICTNNGIDFGATWFQTHHEEVLHLLEELGLKKFHQYSKGKSVLVYSTMAPEHYFESDPNVPSAFRIEGGSQALISALAQPFAEKVKKNTIVSDIVEQNELVEVHTNRGVFKAAKVIVTVPPKITTRLRFQPELPEVLWNTMEKTHTWMSNAIKVGLTFSTPFWRDKQLSGTLIGQVGAVTELYDHSNADENHFALMGFVNEGLRDYDATERKQRILDYLVKYLGEEINDFLVYEEKDWSQDWNTSCGTIKSVYMSPAYGNRLFSTSYYNGKLIFSGAETSPKYGGYMDGAIYSGLQAVKMLSQVIP